jgi:hypothetical protein
MAEEAECTKLPMNTTKSVLEAIPTEVLTRIILSLDSKTNRFNLLRVSRWLYDVTSPVLYKSICVSSSDPEYLTSLLCTILEKPWLACEAYELNLSNSWLTDADSYGAGWFTFTHERILDKDLRSICLDRREKLAWLENLRDGNPDAFVRMLAISLPNLEKLTVALPFGRPKGEDGTPDPYFNRTIARAANGEGPFASLPCLTRLSSVIITTHPADIYNEMQYESTRVKHFFKFPSMRHFSAHRIYDSDLLKWDLKSVYPVTRIELGRLCR